MILDAARVAPEKAVLRPALPMFLRPGWNGTDMTAKMTYAEQLRHPKWQKKRLEVLERAEFKCELCSDSETTLNVHHKRYVKGRKAWEYEASELTALCQPCHESAHQNEDNFKAVLASLNPDGPCNINDAMALVAGWTRGHGDVAEAQPLAVSCPTPAVAGMVARELCEAVGWTDGGLDVLMTFARCLRNPGFVAAMRETMVEVAADMEKAQREGGGNA